MSAINKTLNNSKQNISGNNVGGGVGNSSGGGVQCTTATSTVSAGNTNMTSNDILTSSHVSQLQSLSAAKASSTNAPECFGCHKIIKERYLLKALDHLWHEDCLKCVCCDCRLGEVGSTLFTKADLILCKRDYLRSVWSVWDPIIALSLHSLPAFCQLLSDVMNVRQSKL